jgi:maleylacetoacetate isomerase
MNYLTHELYHGDDDKKEWYFHWIKEGFKALEGQVKAHGTGKFCSGSQPSLADACLIPQLYNARRFGVEVSAYPTLLRIEHECLALPAFDAARPERQPDAPEANSG